MRLKAYGGQFAIQSCSQEQPMQIKVNLRLYLSARLLAMFKVTKTNALLLDNAQHESSPKRTLFNHFLGTL